MFTLYWDWGWAHRAPIDTELGDACIHPTGPGAAAPAAPPIVTPLMDGAPTSLLGAIFTQYVLPDRTGIDQGNSKTLKFYVNWKKCKYINSCIHLILVTIGAQTRRFQWDKKCRNMQLTQFLCWLTWPQTQFLRGLTWPQTQSETVDWCPPWHLRWFWPLKHTEFNTTSPLHTHTHTHTYKNRYSHRQTHTYKPVIAHRHTKINIHTCIDTHIHRYTDRCTHTNW